MTNQYLSDADWERTRNQLAARMMVDEGVALLALDETIHPEILGPALEAATMKLAECGVMPESTREDEAA